MLWHPSAYNSLFYFVLVVENEWVFRAVSVLLSMINCIKTQAQSNFEAWQSKVNSCLVRVFITLLVSWSPPLYGWWKLNMDGTCKGNLGRGGVVVLRDPNGRWWVGEVDSKATIALTTSPTSEHRKLGNLIFQCWQWLKKEWQVALHHYYKEVNRVVDWLAN